MELKWINLWLIHPQTKILSEKHNPQGLPVISHPKRNIINIRCTQSNPHMRDKSAS
jgi:hypothetical protein